MGGDAAAGAAGDPVAAGRLLHRRSDAVRRLVRQCHPRQRGQQRAGRARRTSSTARCRWRCTASPSCRSAWCWLAFAICTYVYLFNPAMAGKIKIGAEAAVDRAGPQVLGRRCLFRGVRPRWREAGSACSGRPAMPRSSTARWSTARPSLVQRIASGDAPPAIRVPLPLRLRNDSWPDPAAWRVLAGRRGNKGTQAPCSITCSAC